MSTTQKVLKQTDKQTKGIQTAKQFLSFHFTDVKKSTKMLTKPSLFTLLMADYPQEGDVNLLIHIKNGVENFETIRHKYWCIEL